MYILWRKFESPLFPFYNNIFKSPYYYTTNFHDDRYFPKEIAKWLFLPFYLIDDKAGLSGRAFGDVRLAVVFVLAAIAICIYVLKKISGGEQGQAGPSVTGNSHRFLLAFFLCSYIVWERMFFIYRYAVPLETLAPVIIAILVLYVFRDDKNRTVAIAILFSICVLFTKIPDWGRRAWPETFFNVEVPALQDPDNTIVIMPLSRFERPSYILPFFPKGVRFLRFQTLLTNPEDDSKMQSEMKDILNRHKGPVYLMTRDPDTDGPRLKYFYGFGIVNPQPLIIEGDHEEFGLFQVARY